MRLIFFIDHISMNGGMMQSVLSLVQKLALMKKYDIWLICVKGFDAKSISLDESVHVVITSFEWKISLRGLGVFVTAFKLYKVVKSILKGALLISNDLGPSLLISLFPKWRINELYINRGGRFERPIGKYILCRIILHRILWVSTTSSFQTNLIRKKCFLNIPFISTIGDGLPLPVHDTPIVRKPLTRKLLRLSIVGFISELKNQIVGVKLIRLLRNSGINAELNIFGTASIGSDKKYKEKLEKVIHNENLMEYVHFEGFSEHNVIYGRTDILLSTSFSEGFGRTLVEGMMWKKPVIAYRGAGGPIDITYNGKFGYLVDECTPEAFFEVIIRLLNDAKATNDNVDAAYNYAINHFTEDVMASNYDKLFETLKSKIS